MLPKLIFLGFALLYAGGVSAAFEFFSVGDWGAKSDIQDDNSNAMKAIAQKMPDGPAFLFSVGDREFHKIFRHEHAQSHSFIDLSCILFGSSRTNYSMQCSAYFSYVSPIPFPMNLHTTRYGPEFYNVGVKSVVAADLDMHNRRPHC